MSVCLAQVAAWTTFAESAWAAVWEQIDSEDGIRVYRMEVAGSSLVAFRGEGIVSAPIAKVAWVLADNDHRTQWVDRLAKSVVLQKYGAFDFVVYQHFKLPPLISDRDYVYRASGSRNAKTGVITLKLRSVAHPKAPPTVGVRAHLIRSKYVLTPMKDANQTHVAVEIHTDPRGMLPSWLVNLIQKSWPMKTLTALRKQVKKTFVKPMVLPKA